MRAFLDLSIPAQATLWYLFLVAFFSFLRKSNLTTPCSRAFNPWKHLTRNDIKFSCSGAVLWICWSKTLQHREGILLIPLPLIPNSDLCPVTAIHHYFQLVPTLQLTHFDLSHSPFSPAFSKKPSQPLAWMPRTFLRIISNRVAPHTHISQGFLTTRSSCTGLALRCL